MAFITQLELKEQLFEILNNINSQEEPLFIGEKEEEPLAVLVSLEKYEQLLETIQINSNPDNIDITSPNSKERHASWDDINWEGS